MAQVTVQFATPALVVSGDELLINFADGTQYSVQGATGLQDAILQNAPDVERVRWLAIANRFAKDPLLDSPAEWNGKTVTVDIENDNPAQVFKVT